MIVNSWEETYTQQNGSTVAILLANGVFSVAMFAMPGKWLSKPARADGSIVVPPQDVLVDDPSHFTVLHSINIHKSICSPSFVYQHRFSSKILKAQFVGEFPTVVWCFPTLRLLVGFGMMFFHQLRSQGFLWEENIPDREVRTYHDGRLSPKIRSKIPTIHNHKGRDFPIGFSSTAQPYLIKNLGAKAQVFIIPDLS